MRKLSSCKRKLILTMLVEGNSISSTARACDVSINTVCRMIDLAGKGCKRFHDEQVMGIKGKRDIQCDEIWSYIYCKEKNIENATPYDVGGTVWAFTAIDADSKLLLSYRISQHRDTRTAVSIMKDIKKRLEKRPRLATDSLKAYGIAAPRVFGPKVKIYQSRKGAISKHPTAFVERHNLTIRQSNRRYTRKTNAFSKTFDRHVAMFHIMAVHYNFRWKHKTLRVSPAMAAGITDHLYDYDLLVDLMESVEPKPKKPGPKPGTVYRKRNQ